MNLAPIVYNVETIGAIYAPSLNGAFKELYRLSGIKPRVLAPYGGYRTLADQQKINPNQTVSDHLLGRAVDIDNQGAIRTKIGSSLFVSTLRKFGWRNVQVNGALFPSEPWHFANQSSVPAGSGGTPLPVTPSTPLTDRKDMTTVYHRPASSGVDARWALAGDAPGTPANWIETGTQALGADFVAAHGSSVLLTAAQFESFKGRYLAPLNIGPVTVPPITIPPIEIPPIEVDNTDVVAAIKENTAAVKGLNPPG